MNISELNSDKPPWWLFVAIALPGTIGFAGAIFTGKYFWVKFRTGARRNNGEIGASVSGTVDKRDLEG